MGTVSDLGSHVAAALPGLRAHAVSLLRDVCDMQRRDGSTIDPVTGARVDVWVTYAAGVPLRVRTSVSESVAESGGSQVTAQRLTAAVPWDASAEVGDRLVVTRSGDPSLVGRPLYVRAVPRGTDHALRRLVVTDVQE